MMQSLLTFLVPSAHDNEVVAGPQVKPCAPLDKQAILPMRWLLRARWGLIVVADAVGFLALMAGGFLLLRLLELSL